MSTAFSFVFVPHNDIEVANFSPKHLTEGKTSIPDMSNGFHLYLNYVKFMRLILLPTLLSVFFHFTYFL